MDSLTLLTIPHHSDFRLGFDVDFTNLQCHQNHLASDFKMKPISAQSNTVTACYSVIKSLGDVCQVLGIRPEYVLKVQTGIVENCVVQECLKDVYTSNCITVVFRVAFLQKSMYMPDDNTDVKNLKDKETAMNFTHTVSAVDIGNELVVVMKLSSTSSEPENISNFTEKLLEALIQPQGNLDDATLSKLEQFAVKSDKRLNKSHYKDMGCSIHYGSFSDEERDCPANLASLTGMVAAIRHFQDKCRGWMQMFETGDCPKVDTTNMMVLKKGVDWEPEAANTNKAAGGDDYEKIPKVLSNRADNVESEGESDSVVVLGKGGTCPMYNLRVTLQSCKAEEGAENAQQDTNDCFSEFDKLSDSYNQSVKAKTKLKAFLDSKPFIPDARQAEKNNVQACIQSNNCNIRDLIQDLDNICKPSDKTVHKLCSVNPIQTVEDFIEVGKDVEISKTDSEIDAADQKKVTSKLPTGDQLDLLLIGKTGYGKSCTGNAILGQQKFVTSSSMTSTTKTEEVAWARIDGRIIQVVDTPGMCDTSFGVTKNIEAISKAIGHCEKGFHALLIVLRFNMKLTWEEKKAIEMLKHIFGEKIISSHVIFVFTHGDNFVTEFKNQKTFDEWCKEQNEPVIKELFDQCSYRCVLFNNKTEDPKVMKQQIVKLVATVDKISPDFKRYTNKLFEFARESREQIIREECLIVVTQEFLRDVRLISDALNEVIQNNCINPTELNSLQDQVQGLLACTENDLTPGVENLRNALLSLQKVLLEEDCSQNMNEMVETLKAVAKDVDQIISEMEKERQVLEEKLQAKLKPEVKSNCFPGGSKVLVKNGMMKSLEDVEIGDQILVRNSAGKLCYDKVYMFGHRDPDSVLEYIVFHINGSQCGISVSKEHLVFCVRNGCEKCLSAKDIVVGDELVLVSGDVLERQPVVGVTHEKKRGIFAPFTKCGNLVVDGALMSCYVDVLPHAISHIILSPLRQLYRLSPSALAIVNGGINNKEIPPLPKLALKLLPPISDLEG